MDEKVTTDSLSLPQAQRVIGTQANPCRVGAAYNRQMGDDRRGMTVFGYFNAAGELFAWSTFDAFTTDIGAVADGWPIYTRWRVFPERKPNGHIQEPVVMLARRMTAGDL